LVTCNNSVRGISTVVEGEVNLRYVIDNLPLVCPLKEQYRFIFQKVVIRLDVYVSLIS
jgi:hypothetical protein